MPQRTYTRIDAAEAYWEPLFEFIKHCGRSHNPRGFALCDLNGNLHIIISLDHISAIMFSNKELYNLQLAITMLNDLHKNFYLSGIQPGFHQAVQHVYAHRAHLQEDEGFQPAGTVGDAAAVDEDCAALQCLVPNEIESSIVMITSNAAFENATGGSAYCASKAGSNALIKGITSSFFNISETFADTALIYPVRRSFSEYLQRKQACTHR